jgi:anti-sigma B factor antagonist
MLTVDVQSEPSVATLLCHGRIVLGVEAETLRCLATSRQERRINLDLQGVRSMDAAGLGLLAELHCWARQRMGSLTISRPSPHVCRLLALTHLGSVLKVEECGEEEDYSVVGQNAMSA